MADPALFAADPDEPLGLWSRPVASPPEYADLRSLRFEFSSRGDRVPGRLLKPPDGSGPFPLVLLQHGRGGSKDATYLDGTGGPWARAGAAVASIDFPLHGERADPKLGDLVARRPDDAKDGTGRILAIEFARQAVIDLRRALDALSRLEDVDASRIVYAGFSLGAILGSIFCGVDPRPRAAALALGGAGLSPRGSDPGEFIAGAAGRPLLFIGATRDEVVPRSATEALFAAAPEPKQLLWFDATHRTLPGAALKEMWNFLRPHLLGPG